MINGDGRQEPWEIMKAEEICEGKVKLESEEYSKYQVRKATITEGPHYMGQYKAKMLNCKLEN